MHTPSTRHAYPFLDLLEAEAEAIRTEALALGKDLWLPMHGYQAGCFGCVLEPGRWADGFPGMDFSANRSLCPRTAALIAHIPGLELGGFLRMDPGALMLPHTDPRDDHLVRCHLGLQLTEEEQAWWPPNTARLMDVRQSHWGRNLGDFPRLTMVVDVRMSFVVPENAWGPWRPDAPGIVRPPEAGPGVNRLPPRLAG